jgi:ketosteroid isomerase-like protein
MIAWIARRVVQRVYSMQNNGDHERVVRTFARDAVFEFCGDTPFAGERRGRACILEWFAEVHREFGRLHLIADDVAVSGPPWHTRVIVRFHDRYELINGERLTNHGFQFMRIAWGRVKEDRILVDLGVVHEALRRIGSGRHSTSST